ncbi:MAG: hypothetical protein ALECFALPRED_002863 [Alectoria fallacina]|uniref:M protein, serotype 2.1 n=1 Tax=Alectoria fallacina TaxID=1903189 RepID=A0A8H3FGR8_9LECA|nr:MAG: hypothetical protein ALECFALPRED_002863 [Alectoria fallacina]
MSAPNKKTAPPNNGTHTRPPANPSSRSSPSKSSTSINGLGRSPSLRGGLSRPGRGSAVRSSPQTSFLSVNTTASDEASEDDARAEHVSLMDELRSRVQKAETASEEYQRQLILLQARLDDSQQEQSQLEDQLHQSNRNVEELESERTQSARQKREMQDLYETERTSMLKDKAEQKTREDELTSANQRLKESLAQRETRNNDEDSRTGSPRTRESDKFAPPAASSRMDSKDLSKQDTSKQVMQKDQVIKSLRLELAEAQIKIMELDTDGGGRVHELEKQLLETRIANARLMEDNESFQLLLSEKTLNGDFGKTEAMQQSSGLGSLAEELGSEEIESTDERSDDYRRLETEVKSLKDQNKALAKYIETIIGRLLSHKEFENILDKTPDLMSGAPRPRTANTDKELPPPPPAKDDEPAPTFLQRATSVIAGSTKRPRPISQVASSPAVQQSEDPTKAPTIPLDRPQPNRTSMHMRSQSEMPNAAPLVNQMYRGPPSTGSGGPMLSPGISPGLTTTTRTSFFSPPLATNSNATSRVPSGSASRASREGNNAGSSSNSTFSDHSGGVDGSPPRSNGSSGPNNYTGAVMTQSRLRPLRLVQENPKPEEDAATIAARKKASRGSWMPTWMNAQKTGMPAENNP